MAGIPGGGNYAGRRVTILGLGSFGGGAAAARYFHNKGAIVTVTDKKNREQLSSSLVELADLDGIQYVFGEHRRKDIIAADIVVVNPAVPDSSPPVRWAKAAGVRIEREINIVMKSLKCLTIGVTGSNGKSTTTALIGAMAGRQYPGTLVGGNIGRSLLPALETHSCDVPAVLELSSFQLKGLADTKISPDIAIVTNLTLNHLDRHKTFEDYAQSKYNILRYQSPDDIAVLNADDPVVRVWQYWAKAHRVMMFSTRRNITGTGAFAAAGAIWLVSSGMKRKLCELDKLLLPGEHNLSNTLAAVCAAQAAGVSDANIVRALSEFTGLPHRLETVAVTPTGVRYINDSIATTPQSVVAALRSFSQPVTLIAGGYDKGIPFDEMAAAMVKSTVRRILLAGATSQKIASALKRARWQGRIIKVDSLPQAVETACSTAMSGEVVLLSPGCASYDQFSNYVERGNTFRGLVRASLKKQFSPALVHSESAA